MMRDSFSEGRVFTGGGFLLSKAVEFHTQPAQWFIRKQGFRVSNPRRFLGIAGWFFEYFFPL
jgi:hypothetical protein